MACLDNISTHTARRINFSVPSDRAVELSFELAEMRHLETIMGPVQLSILFLFRVQGRTKGTMPGRGARGCSIVCNAHHAFRQRMSCSILDLYWSLLAQAADA